MDFAQMLRIAMEGLTQDQLSVVSGVPQTNISKYLLGKAQPTYPVLEALERALPKLRELRNAKYEATA